MDHEARLRITENQLTQRSTQVTPPDGFNPLKVSNTELVKYGLPSRPDKKTQPKLRTQWESTMSRALSFVIPKFDTKGRTHIHLSEKPTASTTPLGNFLVGALKEGLPAGETIVTVTAKWSVPNIHPPKAGDGLKDGTYECSAWVGIDGFYPRPIASIAALLAGTTTRVVVSGGQITLQEVWAWSEFYPAFEIVYADFSVKPGDLVNFVVCGEAGSPNGQVGLVNLSTNTTVTRQVSQPSGMPLGGATAEWVMETTSVDFGVAMIFNDAIWASAAGDTRKEGDLYSATEFNFNPGGSSLSEPSSHVLELTQTSA